MPVKVIKERREQRTAELIELNEEQMEYVRGYMQDQFAGILAEKNAQITDLEYEVARLAGELSRWERGEVVNAEIAPYGHQIPATGPNGHGATYG